jgi:uncharacterized membrane protein
MTQDLWPLIWRHPVIPRGPWNATYLMAVVCLAAFADAHAHSKQGSSLCEPPSPGGQTIVYVVMAIVGAVLASWLRLAGGSALSSVVLGALGGLAWAELRALRERVARFEQQSGAPAAVAPRAPPPPVTPSPPSSVTPTAWSNPAAAERLMASLRLGPQDRQGAGPPGVLGRLIGYFTGGNGLARAGVVLLFFGVAFLLRYLVEHFYVSVTLRLLAIAVAGALLLGLGLVLRRRRRGYALVLQGGGLGIHYLTAYAALRFFSLLSAAPTLATLVALTVVTAGLAVMQGSQALAMLAVTGGFLAPLLTLSIDGSPVQLFSYYALLNGAILGIAWHRSWRALNLVGFTFTVVLAALWGLFQYHDGLLPVVEPFLALFFLMYLAIAILSAFRQSSRQRAYVDATIVFGAPVVTMAFQSALLHAWPHALATCGLLLSGLYFLLSWPLRRVFGATHRLLAESFTALAVAFLTAALPLATEGRHWPMIWALEGAALLWIGCRQPRALLRAAGAVLLMASGALVWAQREHALPLEDPGYLDGLFVGAAAVLGAAIHRKNQASTLLRLESAMPGVLLGWGVLWWLYAGYLALTQQVAQPYGMAADLVFVSTTALALAELGVRLPFALARSLTRWLLPVLCLFALPALLNTHHPLGDGGWLAWPLAFAAFYVICVRQEGVPEEQQWMPLLHAGGAGLLILLATQESAFQLARVGELRDSWPALCWAVLPAAALVALPWLTRNVAWPFRRHRKVYGRMVSGALAAYLTLWSLASDLLLPELTYPGSLLPVLKGVDFAEVAVLLVLAGYLWKLRAAREQWAGDDEPPLGVMGGVLLALTVVWLHAILLRSLHFWAGIDYDFEALLRSTLVQTSLSIFWATIAFSLMLRATWRASRPLWIGGALLLAAVILKLFLIDLAHIGSIERIVSFLGVGVLTLVIGYFAPGAPAQRTAGTERQDCRDAGGPP